MNTLISNHKHLTLLQRFQFRCGPLWPIVAFMCCSWLFLSFSRLLLVLWQWDRVTGVHGFLSVMGFGIRMDTILLCYAMMIPAVLALCIPNFKGCKRVWSYVLALWLSLWATLLVFMEIATPSYINEYDVRPGRMFIEYLVYPKEVFSTLWSAYKPELALVVILVPIVMFYSYRYAKRAAASSVTWRWWVRLLLVPLIAALMFMGSRSSINHRPANPSTAAFSRDHLVNELALDSTYSLLYAIYSLKDEVNSARLYGNLPRDEIIRRIQSQTGLPRRAFNNVAIPTLHYHKATHYAKKPLNLVIILEESLGAEYVKSLGGLSLAPNLDRLAKKGMWFTQLYATGTRSVRGIEAVLSGFPPTPARSIVKLGLSQHGFYTLAKTLKQQGYTTEFIYGGESQFDNMKSFFMSNGFDRAIDENDYPQANFRGSWGVSDEDLFDRANAIFSQHSKQQRPFFAFVFTTSFHSPFEFPAGKIKLYEQPQNTAHNSVKYADYALGKFFDQAKKQSYWENTVFLVVADHDSRVFGASLIPVEHFHIPGLIIGPHIKPQNYTKVASQIDLAPTLLSLLGINNVTPMIGRDLTQTSKDYPGRAIFQYGNTHAVMFGNQIIIREPFKVAKQYEFQNCNSLLKNYRNLSRITLILT